MAGDGPMGKLLFLASYPKSGNTWLRLLLANLFTNAKDGVSLDDVNLISVNDNLIDFYKTIDEKSLASLTAADVAKLRHNAQRHIATLKPDTTFVKTHAALMPMAGVPPFASDVLAGAIYIVRNPLDIVPSYARHLDLSIDDAIHAVGLRDFVAPRYKYLLEYLQGSWGQNVGSWTTKPHPQILLLRYEDIVTDPISTFGSVVKFLGLDTPQERLERAIAHCDIDRLREKEKTEGFIEHVAKKGQFFGQGGVDAWRRELTEQQARRVVAQNRVQMERFGYIPEGW